MGVICKDQSQTNCLFVLTSAQLFRQDDHDLANSMRNGGVLVSVRATFSFEVVSMFGGWQGKPQQAPFRGGLVFFVSRKT